MTMTNNIITGPSKDNVVMLNEKGVIQYLYFLGFSAEQIAMMVRL